MERKLPTVEVMGTTFYVDVMREELRQKDDSRNRIPFSVFDLEGDGYTFLYDTELKTAVEDKSEVPELGVRYRWVTLPALMELDPAGIALKYNIPLDILCPELAEKQGQPDDDEEEEDEYPDQLF